MNHKISWTEAMLKAYKVFRNMEKAPLKPSLLVFNDQGSMRDCDAPLLPRLNDRHCEPLSFIDALLN